MHLGDGAYGVSTAAETYFGKSVQSLDLARCALLAELPQAPSYDNLYVHFKAAKARQLTVLQNMVTVGDITDAQAKAAHAEPLHPRNVRSSRHLHR